MVYDFAIPNEQRWTDGGWYDDSMLEADYTVEVNTLRLPVVIERKSLSDWFGSVGRDRKDFEDRLARMANYDHAAVIIEATEQAVRAGYQRSKVSGLGAWASAKHWGVVYGIHFHFAGNWNMGRMGCQRILEEFAWHWWLDHQDSV